MRLSARPLLDNAADQGLFVGREDELDSIEQSLSSGLNCLVVGPPGSGKTSLVRAVMYRSHEAGDPLRFSHVRANAAQSAADLLTAVLAAVRKPGGSARWGGGDATAELPAGLARRSGPGDRRGPAGRARSDPRAGRRGRAGDGGIRGVRGAPRRSLGARRTLAGDDVDSAGERLGPATGRGVLRDQGGSRAAHRAAGCRAPAPADGARRPGGRGVPRRTDRRGRPTPPGRHRGGCWSWPANWPAGPLSGVRG